MPFARRAEVAFEAAFTPGGFGAAAITAFTDETPPKVVHYRMERTNAGWVPPVSLAANGDTIEPVGARTSSEHIGGGANKAFVAGFSKKANSVFVRPFSELMATSLLTSVGAEGAGTLRQIVLSPPDLILAGGAMVDESWQFASGEIMQCPQGSSMCGALALFTTTGAPVDLETFAGRGVVSAVTLFSGSNENQIGFIAGTRAGKFDVRGMATNDTPTESIFVARLGLTGPK